MISMNQSIAHRSPEPIDISCGLTNMVSLMGPKIQYVSYAISPTVLSEHFDLKNGIKTLGGFLKTLVSVEVIIKTETDQFKKTGSIMVAYHEKGSIEVIQFHPMNGHLLPYNIFIEFVDDESYNQSMKNRVVSCKIFP